MRLTELLVTLAEMGTTVVIGTTPDVSNRAFEQRLRRLFRDRSLEGRLVIDSDDTRTLHEKAITGDDYVVVGSMNLTFNGVFVREQFPRVLDR